MQQPSGRSCTRFAGRSGLALERIGGLVVLAVTKRVLITLLLTGLALTSAGSAPAVASHLADGPSYEPSLSATGRYVAFRSYDTELVPGDTNEADDIFLYDRTTDTTMRVSVASGGAQAEGDSSAPSVSSDARYVAFRSNAANLVPGDTNGVEDIFVRDQVAGTTRRISVSSGRSGQLPK